MPRIRLAKNMDSRGSPLHLQYSHIDDDRPARQNPAKARRRLNVMLLNAAWDGQKSRVKQLIRSGAYLLATDKDGNTPLHRAAFMGRTRTVKLLIKHAQKKGIARSLLLAGTKESRWTALHCAAWRRYPQICDIILNSAQEIGLLGAMLNARDAHGNDALKRARQSNSAETLSVLFMYEDRASMGPDATNHNI